MTAAGPRETAESYRWIEGWARLPDTETVRANGRTHGVAALRDGRVVVFAQAQPAMYFFTPDGKVESAWGMDWPDAHGLTLCWDGERESLWLTGQDSGQVRQLSLDGEVMREIPRPEGAEPYSPTWVAASEASELIWVADGYGSNVVRGYDRSARLMITLNGEEGPGRFARPHGIALDPSGRLWIADRRNRRIVRYSAGGNFLDAIDGVCHSPCGFAFGRELVYVPELFGSVRIANADFTSSAEVGANPDVRPPGGWEDQEGWGWPTLPGWPNLLETHFDRPGAFLAPHAAALSAVGELFVVEWVQGGRISKLTA